MKIRAPLIPALALALYAALPYAALLKLRHDLRTHDVAALQSDIDWQSVRNGLKQDVLDGLEGRPAATEIAAVSEDDLPPFGASFAAGMADNAVDRQVTPARLADAFAAMSSAGGTALPPRVECAHFEGVTGFEVKIRTAQESPADAPVRLTLALVRHGWQIGWQVTRVWLPATLMQPGDVHSS